MVVKKCFIPTCKNNTETMQQKIFLRVPSESHRREKWLEAAGCKKYATTTLLYCCEDHFDLSKDSENWIHFNTMGSRILLRPEVVPHRNLRQNVASPERSQLTESAKRRRLENISRFKDLQAPSQQPVQHQQLHVDEEKEEGQRLTPPRVADDSQEEASLTILDEQESPSVIFLFESEMKQVIPNSYRIHHGIQVNLRPEMRSVAVDATISTTSRGTSTIPDYCLNEGASSGHCSKLPLLSSNSPQDKISTYQPSTQGNDSSFQRFYLGISFRDVLITFKRIRQGDKYGRLARDYELSTSNVQQIFTNALPKLANALNELIHWPETRCIARHLPIQFRI